MTPNMTLNEKQCKDDMCALMICYAACSGNSLPKFRDDLSVPSSKVKMRPISCPETPVRNLTTCCVITQKRAELI